ncbi:helix-turn-helix domain-containing protein [Chelativorans xinjiangense]|uniref:helix-turn-helix domain-containing protein n=1 Tax=Chelativorans xinjiangense TaxID=2681485 RepID=UPI0013589A05|nr:AraC family transcriptional regulator [Chelativorans xinjiangense]
MLTSIPEDIGRRATTLKGSVVHAIRPPGAQIVKSRNHLAKILLTPSPGIQVSRGSDEMRSFDAPAGMINVSPAGLESNVRWSSTKEYVAVAIEPEYLLGLAAQEFGMGDVELQPPPFGTVDPLALNVAQLLKAELTTGEPPNELYVDSLLTLFGIHLLRNYSSGSKTPVKVKGGLSAESARLLREYMAENFASKLSVPELAAICGLSPNYFIHAFTRTFGQQPHRYLIGLRLDFAVKLLAETDLPYNQVAFMSGFSSHSHLTSAMSKYRQKTPAMIRTKK